MHQPLCAWREAGGLCLGQRRGAPAGRDASFFIERRLRAEEGKEPHSSHTAPDCQRKIVRNVSEVRLMPRRGVGVLAIVSLHVLQSAKTEGDSAEDVVRWSQSVHWKGGAVHSGGTGRWRGSSTRTRTPWSTCVRYPKRQRHAWLWGGLGIWDQTASLGTSNTHGSLGAS